MKIQMLGTLASTSASVWTSVTITFTTSRYKEQQKYLLKVFWICHLQAIHNFVEVLNEYFHNVCELDLVFNFYKVWKNGLRSEVLNLCCKVYTVVDEMFLAGEIRETSQTKVSNIFSQ